MTNENGQMEAESVRKIVLTDTAGFGGIAQYTFTLGRALCRFPLDITLLTVKHPEWDPRELSCTVRTLFGGHARFKLTLLKGISYARTLILILLNLIKTRPQLLHLQETKFPAGEGFLFSICRILGIRTVLTMHDLHMLRRRQHRPVGRLIKKCDGIIVHSEDSRKRFHEIFGAVHPRGAMVIPHGNYNHLAAPLDKKQARRNLSIDAEINVVLCFGYLQPYKGIDVLLDAIPETVTKIRDVLFLIAGKPVGPVNSYAAQIMELGIEQHVILRAEYIPPEEVPSYFSSADAVVLPYRDVTQSGLVFLAYAYGKPVIASAVGGIPEIVTDGETGYLVPPGNPVELSRALVALLGYGERAETLGATGRRLMEDRFGWDTIAEKTYAFYERIINNAGI